MNSIFDDTIAGVKELLNSSLTTKADAQDLSDNIGVSVATMYRYKKEPELIPFGILLKIKEYLGHPINTPDYVLKSPNDFVVAEERRLSFEQSCSGGSRYVVTPIFSVNSETEEFTRAVAKYDYPEATDEQIENLVKIRRKRCVVYKKGEYKSFELIDASKYRDFYLGVNRFSMLSQECINRQVDELVKSTLLSNVERRIYLYNTPELPVVSCYEVDTKKKAFLKCVVRADDFVTEYTNENSSESATEIKKMFDKFYETKTNLVTPEDVIDFLKNPMKYPLF